MVGSHMENEQTNLYTLIYIYIYLFGNEICDRVCNQRLLRKKKEREREREKKNQVLVVLKEEKTNERILIFSKVNFTKYTNTK